MGFGFKKSKKLGILNFTLTSKGVGVSAGNKLFRVSRSATGRKTARVSIPKTGIFYTANIGKKSKKKR